MKSFIFLITLVSFHFASADQKFEDVLKEKISSRKDGVIEAQSGFSSGKDVVLRKSTTRKSQFSEVLDSTSAKSLLSDVSKSAYNSKTFYQSKVTPQCELVARRLPGSEGTKATYKIEAGAKFEAVGAKYFRKMLNGDPLVPLVKSPTVYMQEYAISKDAINIGFVSLICDQTANVEETKQKMEALFRVESGSNIQFYDATTSKN